VLNITHGGVSRDSISQIRSQLVMPEEFRRNINRVLVPETIHLATGDPSNASTRSAPGFDILAPAH